MKKKKSTSYNTGGTYQPVGLPVDPAQIRAQKKQKREEQGNFWTGLAQFATQYVAPMVAGPLGSAIGGAVQSIGMANRSATTAGPGNYAQDTTQVLPNQELQLSPNQQNPWGYNYGGPVTPMPVDSLPYTPVVTNPISGMMTSSVAPTPNPRAQYMTEDIYKTYPKGNMFKPIAVGHPGPVNANTLANMKEGSSGHVKSKDRYREHRPGYYSPTKGYQTGGDVQLNESAFQVQGNANQVDGNTYNMGNQQVALDHNEVVKDNFVFSDSIVNPITGNKFSKDAKKIEKRIGKAEMKIQSYNDMISKKTLKHLNNMSNALKVTQEAVATDQGHRNEDGSTKQNFATGGVLQSDPPKYILVRPGKRKPELGIYYDPKTDKYLSRNSLGKYHPVSSENQKAYRSLYPPSTLTHGTTKSVSQVAASTPPQMGPPINTLGSMLDAQMRQQVSPINTDPPLEVSPTPARRTNIKSAKTSTIPWEEFNTKEFKEWYNAIPGGNPISVNDKWDTDAQAAFKDVGEQYMRTQGKNVIPDQFGGRSTLTADGYVDVTPTTSPGGKLTGISTTPQTLSPFPVPPTPTAQRTLPTGQFGQPMYTNPVYSYQTAEDGTPLETLNENLPYQTDGPFAKPIPTYTTIPQETATDPTSPISNQSITLGRNLSNQPPTATPPIVPQDQEYKVPFTAGDALQAVGVGSKFFQALSPIEVEPTYANTAPISQQSYDPRGNLGQNQRNFQNALNSIQGGSLNTRRSVANSILGQRLNADSQVLDRYQQMNVGARTQFEERLGARQRENIGYATYANDLNARNRAARANNLDAAFDSLSYFGAGLNEKRQAQDVINIYRKLFPSIGNNVLSAIQ